MTVHPPLTRGLSLRSSCARSLSQRRLAGDVGFAHPSRRSVGTTPPTPRVV